MNKQNEYLYPVNFFYKQNRPWQKKICRGGNLLAILSDYTNYFIIFTLDFCPFFFKSLLYAFSFLAGTLIFAFETNDNEKRNFPVDFSVYTENLFLPFYRYGI